MRVPVHVLVHLLKQGSGLFSLESFERLLQDPASVRVAGKLADVSYERLMDEFGTSVQSDQSLSLSVTRNMAARWTA